VQNLRDMAKPVIDLEQIKQVAICSSNQDHEIGTIIAEAMDRVGKDGVITIEEGGGLKNNVSVIDGLQFPRGYLSPQFATDPETLRCEYEDPAILLISDRVDNLKLLLSILEFCVRNLSQRPIVIVADEFSDECLSALILNRLRRQLNIVAVKAPGYGDRRLQSMQDIAIAIDASVLSKNGAASLSNIQQAHIGTCKKIIIDRDTTTILEGAGKPEDILSRIELLRSRLANTVGDFDRERIQERLARLSGGVARISVGGATEVEVREKKDRVEDALNACKAAIEEGILPGGAIAAIWAAHTMDYKQSGEGCHEADDFNTGVNIIVNAVKAPLRQIAINAGWEAGVVVREIAKSGKENYGFDARAKTYGDMIELGIIVPAKVERIALQNAASIAGLLLTTDCAISIIREKQDQVTPQFPSLA